MCTGREALMLPGFPIAHVVRLVPALLLAPPVGPWSAKSTPIVPRKRSGSGAVVTTFCAFFRD